MASEAKIKNRYQSELECPRSQPGVGEIWDPSHLRRIQEHPCYSIKAVHAFGRIHLPVAPKCNIECNYCIREFDCVHESRPGVTSRLITPEEALERLSEVVAKFPNIKVVGIAGPGEPLFNEETFETFRLVKNTFPHLSHCVSSNGLLLSERLGDLIEAGIDNITVTVNAIAPEIAQKIYSLIIYHGKTYRGLEGAQILIKNQLAGIEGAVKKGVILKVNTVLIPSINDHHILDIAKKAKGLGAHIHNIMPLIPQHKLAHLRPPTTKERKRIQDECEKIIPQMRHCRQCRADTIGKLGEDVSAILDHVASYDKDKIRVAVTTKGLSGLVDLHFGHTKVFFIYEVNLKNSAIRFLEKREAIEPFCKGPECDLRGGQEALLQHIVDLIKDCRFLISRRIGAVPSARLKNAWIIPVEDTSAIENAIRKAITLHTHP